jgi:hypothetical protein
MDPTKLTVKAQEALATAAERARITKAIEAATKEAKSLEGRLNNPAFVEKAKPEAQAKVKTEAKAKPKMKGKEHEEKTLRQVEKEDLPEEGLEPAAQQSEQRVEDQDMYCTCSCQQPLHNVMRMCLVWLVSCMHHAGPRDHPGGARNQSQGQDLHPRVLGQP